ncbi:MAG: V-type ATP synthase subunit D [Clostridiaceae bacterium]|jgi:V/A-type H+-transporting ATPase subunit D|nr:V-type ATP synthase subunit D [Clostridiaceae bacterium]
MAVMRVNPNRMELLRLKGQLRIARRGHKLLKDKRDEMMRQFLAIVLDVDTLREKMEALLAKGHRKMLLARAAIGGEVVDEALMAAGLPVLVAVTQENTMSVRTPIFRVANLDDDMRVKRLPYGMTTAPGQLDDVLDTFAEALPLLMELATLEHKSHLLAAEIERTRRRVNSLEYVMIPSIEETIHSITMKMDENERGNLTRLMKVKDMIVEQELTKRREKTEQRRDGYSE